MVLVSTPAWIAHVIVPAAFALMSYRFLITALTQVGNFRLGGKTEVEE
jgi:hypothetical protein